MLSDHAANESRTLRERLAAAGDALDVLDAGGDPACSAAMVAQTTSITAYPTSAAAMYAVIPCNLNGAESEGSAATYVPQTGTKAFALNVGTGIPPSGTTVICHATGGRWCFRFD